MYQCSRCMKTPLFPEFTPRRSTGLGRGIRGYYLSNEMLPINLHVVYKNLGCRLHLTLLRPRFDVLTWYISFKPSPAISSLRGDFRSNTRQFLDISCVTSTYQWSSTGPGRSSRRVRHISCCAVICVKFGILETDLDLPTTDYKCRRRPESPRTSVSDRVRRGIKTRNSPRRIPRHLPNCSGWSESPPPPPSVASCTFIKTTNSCTGPIRISPLRAPNQFCFSSPNSMPRPLTVSEWLNMLQRMR
ncbi:hypothetical protein DFH09DRAFT_137217 [Mycena vulgaris]|nr:hypothetical protein DFH09DRAFT_137217 [Mycena vulgaris]